MLRNTGAADMAAADEVEQESLKDEITNLIEEARMVLPGIQALFGFQLIAVFNDGFRKLEPAWQYTHLAAISLVTAAIVLIMTPAAYHRIAERGVVSRRFSELGSKLIALAMIPFAVAMSLDLMLITHVVTGSGAASAVTLLVTLAAFLTAWFVFPLRAGRGHRRNVRCT
jgi:hypothetical protein